MGLTNFNEIPEEALLALGKVTAAHMTPEEILAAVTALESNLHPILEEAARVRLVFSHLLQVAETDVKEFFDADKQNIQQDLAEDAHSATELKDQVEAQVQVDGGQIPADQAELLKDDIEHTIDPAAGNIEG